MPLMQRFHEGSMRTPRPLEPTTLEAVVVGDDAGNHPEPWLTVPNIFRVLRRRFGFIILLTFALSVVGIGVTLVLPRSYRAETLIIVDARRPQISNVPEVISQLPAEQVVLRSEVDALGSNDLIRSVVKSANLAALAEFNPLLQIGAPWGWLFWIDSDRQRQLESEFTDLVQRIRSYAGIAADEGESSASDEDVAAVVAESYRRKLRVSTDGRSLTIRLSISSSSPELAAQLANLHANLYLAQQLKSKSLATEHAHAWLAQRIVPLKADVQRTEAAVQKYREEHQLIVGEKGITITAQQLSELNTQLAQARADTAYQQARLTQVRELIRSGTSLESVPEVLASPTVQKLREQETIIARLEADAAARYTNAMHPAIISARAQLKELQNALKAEAGKVATSLQRSVEVYSAKERNLEQALGELTKRAAGANLAEVKLHELEREAESTRGLYQTFLNRLQETSVGAASNVPDSRILSTADVPRGPVFPKYAQFFAASVVLASLGSTALAFLLEGMQDRLHSPTECRDLTGVRGLGLVPQVTRWSRVPLADRVVDEREMPRDAVRAVLELLFAARARTWGVRPCSIAITSTLPHEGKTVLAIWLARVSAMTGLRVLLVDADLRNPSVERYLKSQAAAAPRRDPAPEDGLQSMVTEDTVTGMHYVTCHPIERVCGTASLGTVEGILREARDSYDLVVVDSAPVLAAPESLSICQMTDGVVLAVRWGHTRYRQVRYAASMLRSVSANVLGAVVTRADVRKHSLYGFGDVGDVYHQYPRYYRT
jgi:uncharacterized protein involved in exopolysaccharide biosynthesis/Mrp family chromosome partitioning ATPase